MDEKIQWQGLQFVVQNDEIITDPRKIKDLAADFYEARMYPSAPLTTPSPPPPRKSV